MTSLSRALMHEDVEEVERLLSSEAQDGLAGRNLKEESPLHVACRKGNVELIKVLVRHGIDDFTVRDEDGCTPLIVAAKCKQYGCILATIRMFDCNPNIRDLQGRSLLHFACADGNINLVHVLVQDCKADLNIKDDNGDTPLLIAAKNRKGEVVKSLVCEYGCDPNVKDCRDRTPLHLACVDGDIDLVHVLVKDCNANLNIRDTSSDMTAADAEGNNLMHIIVHDYKADLDDAPLLLAARNKKGEVVKLLVCDYGCDPNVKDSKGRTPLHLACINGDIDLVHVLVNDCKADLNIRNASNDTPLMTAAKNKQYKTWESLVCDYGCDPNVKGMNGETLLHWACAEGNVDLVHVLVRDCKADLSIKDISQTTPLMTAVEHEQYRVWESLVCDYGCDPNVKGLHGKTLLHFACDDNNIDLVHKLVRDCKVDFSVRDDSNNVPLIMEAKNKEYKIIGSLIRDYGMDPNVKCFQDRTLLHFACANGNIDLVHVLIRDYKADLNLRDVLNDTPLSLAIKRNQYDIWESLVCDYGCSPDLQGFHNRTLLHLACVDGNIDLVHVLVRDCKADMNVRDDGNNTPLIIAAKNKQDKIVELLVCGYGCDPNVKGFSGKTPLHFACANGNLDLVRVLIQNCNADLSIRDGFDEPPLILAARNKRYEVVKSLISEYGCDPNIKEIMGRTPLHVACADGDIELVHMLVRDHKADLNIRDDLKYTPLMTAVRKNKVELVKILISEYKCDANVILSNGGSLLHIAGGAEVLTLLIEEFKLSPSAADSHGDTPLHLFVSQLNFECVRVLLFDFHAPVYINNKAGHTPWIPGRVDSLFNEYLSSFGEEIEAGYKSMQSLSAKKYSGSNFVCRLFVVGHPGAGKSSLVEALKREGFFESISRVSEKSVPPHTGGIVPSVFISKGYGRIQFYDFAGDPEYYSSHAAILEKMFQSDIGTNICIVVLNLVEGEAEIEKKYYYWMSFIMYSFEGLRELPSIIVIGSHFDKLSGKDIARKESYVQNLISSGKDRIYLSLDCCSPRSESIKSLRQSIHKISKKSEPYSLSYNECILLGLLEKDFSNVTTCRVQTIANSIERVNLSLPRSVPLLYPILQQLQAIGMLLVVGGRDLGSHVVLNIAQLTNEVHKKLFSVDAFLNNRSLASFNVGLLPESLLQEVLPKYITKECLIQLQYCQEVSHIEIGSDHSVSPSNCGSEVIPTSLDKSYLFFPALCSLDKKNVSWQTLGDGSYTIGWLARCSDPHDFFPPRFLHVLLLRIALRFTLAVASCVESGGISADHKHLKRRCKMWKTGVHWLSGDVEAECEVDVIDSKEVVVSIQSSENSKACLTLFNSIISCVMEAKAEFCGFVKLDFFLLDRVGCLANDNLFSIVDVQRALKEGKPILSILGEAHLSSSKLVHIHSSFWDSLFPINEHSVLKYINVNTIGDKLIPLGTSLDINFHTLKGIEYNHPKDIKGCIEEMVSAWLSSSLAHSSSEDHPYPPCWWRLVEALREINMNKLAEDITEDKGEHIAVQGKLLNSQDSQLIPDEEFLESFAEVVGSKWPYLASLLPLTSSTIEEVRREGEGLTQKECALSMLHKWVSKGEATYYQLYQKLKPVSLFNY